MFAPVHDIRWAIYCNSLSAQIRESNATVDLTDFFAVEQWNRIKQLTATKDIAGVKYIRIGSDSDGGYILADTFSDANIVYSFGIAEEISFDLAMAHRGLPVYMYDHTISKLPEMNPNFHFFKTGICGEGERKSDLLSMKAIIEANGHQGRTDIILKMDVEGYEYDFLYTSDDAVLSQFSQIVLELHNISKYEWVNRIVRALEKLNRTHQAVHVHANNGGGVFRVGDEWYPSLLEITYVRRSDFDFIPNNRFFPTEIDRPCSNKIDEIFLGKW